jgi:hypothetical protein
MDAALDIPLSETERVALPVAMARQPLSSIGGWVARLDDPAAARRHLASVGPELAAALELMTELDRWQDAFAWPERRGRSGHLTSAAARPGSAGGARRPAASG